MTMHGYDIAHVTYGYGNDAYNKTTYRAYTWKHENNRTVKHYRNGYASYKQMIAAHPELSK